MAKKKVAPQKSCPKCGTMVHARKNVCTNCSHVFVAKKKKKKRAKMAVVKRAPIAAVETRVVVKKKRKRRGRPTAAAAGGGSFSLADIQAAKGLIGKLGSSSKAKKLIDALG